MTKKLHCAEFVFAGHPDKLSDAIADTLVQEAARRAKRGSYDVRSEGKGVPLQLFVVRNDCPCGSTIG